MKALSALKVGSGITTRKFGIVIFLLIINIIFALVLSIPMFYTLQDSFGDSKVGENMLEGFDTLWYGEFRNEVSGFASSFSPSIMGIGAILNNFVTIERGNLFNIRSIPNTIFLLGVIYLLFGAFLNGGILGAFNSPERKFSFGNFFEDCGKYFIRFFFLMIIAVACYLVLQRFFFPWLNSAFSSLGWVKNATEEKIPFLFDRLKNLIFVIILFFIGMLFDYAKIITVVEQRRNIIASFFRSLGFILTHIIKTFSLYYILVFIGIIFITLYTYIEPLFTTNTLRNIGIVFGIQQVYIILKIWLKCTFFSSQMSLYKGVVVSPEEEELIPRKIEPFAIKEVPGESKSL